MKQCVSFLSYARNSPSPPKEDEGSLPFSQNLDTGTHPDPLGSIILPTLSHPLP